jgi:hypothetical protein
MTLGAAGLLFTIQCDRLVTHFLTSPRGPDRLEALSYVGSAAPWFHQEPATLVNGSKIREIF